MSYATLYAALLWAVFYLLHITADSLLAAQSRGGVTSNTERRWAERAFDYSRVGLVTSAICAGMSMALDVYIQLSTPMLAYLLR